MIARYNTIRTNTPTHHGTSSGIPQPKIRCFVASENNANRNAINNRAPTSSTSGESAPDQGGGGGGGAPYAPARSQALRSCFHCLRWSFHIRRSSRHCRRRHFSL